MLVNIDVEKQAQHPQSFDPGVLVEVRAGLRGHDEPINFTFVPRDMAKLL